MEKVSIFIVPDLLHYSPIIMLDIRATSVISSIFGGLKSAAEKLQVWGGCLQINKQNQSWRYFRLYVIAVQLSDK